MAEAIHDLEPFARSVLLLRSIGHFTHREMAEILESPIGTIMSALSRARMQLRRRLATYASEHGWIDRKSAH
jgi:RNA polymerase sigma-70 factor (ECF subfamily)